jgi:hypothetical protein
LARYQEKNRHDWQEDFADLITYYHIEKKLGGSVVTAIRLFGNWTAQGGMLLRAFIID